MAELALKYLKFAKVYYRREGKVTGAIHGIKVAVRLLREMYADSAVSDFGPPALKAI